MARIGETSEQEWISSSAPKWKARESLDSETGFLLPPTSFSLPPSTLRATDDDDTPLLATTATPFSPPTHYAAAATSPSTLAYSSANEHSQLPQMTTYNLNQSWDLTSPPSLPSLPDDDFLALLQKQFVANNPTTIDFAPFGTKSLQQVPNSANPQSLSHLPITTNNTPPLTDSSPSPPSADNTSGVERANRRNSGGVTSQWLDGGNRNDEDALKRKSQHLDRVNSSRKAASRRKSSGNPAADESRLLKRKEQNRAAQRAFRERKERHVKDLEDRVAALESRNESTQAENENLRDLLQRLQSENLLLKRSAFTFTVPPGSTSVPHPGAAPSGNGDSNPHSAADSPPDSQRPMNLVSNMSSTGASLSSSSSRDSPSSLFEEPYPDMRLYSTPSTVSDNSPKSLLPHEQSFTAGGANPQYRQGNWSHVGSPREEHPPVQMPFTIISSNPMYMSYREPSSAGYSPYGDMNLVSPHSYTHEPPSRSSQPLPSPPILHPASAGPSQAPGPSDLGLFSSPDVHMSSAQSPQYGDFASFTFSPLSGVGGGPTSPGLDDLFGGQFNNLVPFSPFQDALSPVSHPSSSSKPSPPGEKGHDQSGCPKDKDELARTISAQGPSTFAPSGGGQQRMNDAHMNLGDGQYKVSK
ncbi:hypothetical protein SISSUDRAFT_844426 [Sistotremastrum suecicum HHB10207 ss-3]|uniref:BZIP domain-containing protein n=1 Tax=Sistotremastrum suecicum HHB10207 ss-3 TaxID=1314776 RepID=A0A166HIE5_9AGAM|nr:hypothetical protein SISSUDRAFT_844426 [Sistotremastrum suecicum HHB10207 ss-3]